MYYTIDIILLGEMLSLIFLFPLYSFNHLLVELVHWKSIAYNVISEVPKEGHSITVISVMPKMLMEARMVHTLTDTCLTSETFGCFSSVIILPSSLFNF